MVRYLLFAWGDHDARGGMWDLHGIHDTFQGAQRVFAGFDWYLCDGQIIRLSGGKLTAVAEMWDKRYCWLEKGIQSIPDIQMIDSQGWPTGMHWDVSSLEGV